MLSVQLTYPPTTCFTLAVNNAPIINCLRIQNTSRNNYEKLKIKISCEPSFAYLTKEYETTIPVGDSWIKTEICPEYNLPYLYELNKTVEAKLILEIICNEKRIYVNKYDILLLDYHIYWGNTFNSKYLASYVIPHEPLLTPIINRTGELLYKQTGDEVICAHSSDNVNRSIAVIKALYEAIIEQRISFAYPTMCLKEKGQEIHLIKEILSEGCEKKANCLDIALLFCSCVESIGMNPLVIMQDNHAFAGVWLINPEINNSLYTNVDYIISNSLCDTPKVLLLETTYSIYKLKRNQNDPIPFEKACQKASALLLNKEIFAFALDIACARKEGVAPFPFIGIKRN